jgi:chromate reductase
MSKERPVVAVLVGSLRKGSLNKQLARALEKIAGDRAEFRRIRIDDQPLYNQDFDGDYPPVCKRLKDDINACEAVLFVTPEYNRSVPGVLKNAIDIASRPYGASAFAGKPAAVCGTSIGSIGTAIAQQHLRNTLAYLDVPTLGQPEVFIHFTNELIGGDGTINNPDTQKFLQGFADRFVDWVKRFAG